MGTVFRLASMRPRHKAAEYVLRGHVLRGLHVLASMRPRHKAAEYDRSPKTNRESDHDASMRPRHKAAEYDAIRREEHGRALRLQ